LRAGSAGQRKTPHRREVDDEDSAFAQVRRAVPIAMICAMRKAIVVALLGALGIGAAPAAAACTGADEPVTEATAAQAADAIRCLIGEQRAAHGRVAFRHSPKLARIARRYARRMRDEDFFGHTSPDGRTRQERFAAAGYDHRNAENLAFGWETPRIVVRKWMQSGIHHRNILSRRWRFVGVGVAIGSSRERLYTVTFGPARS
jgi:uncharacterized protein YkwD